MNKILIPFFISAAALFFSCTSPLTFTQTQTITVEFPDWPPSPEYPALDHWKITLTETNSEKSFTVSPQTTNHTFTLQKDFPAVIQIQPVINIKDAEEFFLPAGVIYPQDFSRSQNQKALWQKYTVCKTFKTILNLPENKEKMTAINFFNWNKLKETLVKKDETSFTKFDSLKTKKCTVSYNTDIKLLTDRILYPPSRFSVPYFDTLSLQPEKIKNLNLDPDSTILSQYIPLNDFYKEKGWLTVQTEPQNHKTAFLFNGAVIFIQNKSLCPE